MRNKGVGVEGRLTTIHQPAGTLSPSHAHAGEWNGFCDMGDGEQFFFSCFEADEQRTC
jgi:hypothetical protein